MSVGPINFREESCFKLSGLIFKGEEFHCLSCSGRYQLAGQQPGHQPYPLPDAFRQHINLQQPFALIIKKLQGVIVTKKTENLIFPAQPAP